MDKETYEALKNIINAVKNKWYKEYNELAEKNIKLIDKWIDEVAKEYVDEDRSCRKCGKTSGLLEDEDICYACAKERGII